ncbi:MAG: hypothetical protein R3A52_33185 [Polyangiales bacterium]
MEKVLTGTSTRPAKVVTDAGQAMVKLLGNPQGPHALAREWVGTRVAAWLGLPTFDMAMIEYTGDPPIEEVPATAGPAIVLRFVEGHVWDETAEGLARCPPEQIAGLVVADTWLRNDDRYGPPSAARPARVNPRNVFIAFTDDDRRDDLVAMDFTDALRLDRGLSRDPQSPRSTPEIPGLDTVTVGVA